jgi:CHRD domain
MAFKRNFAVWVAVGLVCLAVTAAAQSGDKYKARLSAVPSLNSRGAGITVAADSVKGAEGNVMATLSGKKLTVSGSFEKFASPATEANLFMGPAMGARNYPGTALFKLTLMKAADGKSGTFSGMFDLSTEQVDALKKGKLYLQVHSEGSPTGHVVGWLARDAGK